MAWRSSGATNADLVENLWNNKLITKPEVKAAFLKIDRAHFAPSSPYDDSPKSIGHGATISAPHMHACAAEHLLPFLLPRPGRPAPRVLDVGSGSGYLTVVMAELIGDAPGAQVVAIEHISALRDLGHKNTAKSESGRKWIANEKIKFVVGDGRRGWAEERDGDGEVRKGQWDAIHVGASATEVHQELLDQLRAPGRLFIPVDDDQEGRGQHVWTIDKDEDGKITKKKLFGVRYVPLTDAPT